MNEQDLHGLAAQNTQQNTPQWRNWFIAGTIGTVGATAAAIAAAIFGYQALQERNEALEKIEEVTTALYGIEHSDVNDPNSPLITGLERRQEEFVRNALKTRDDRLDTLGVQVFAVENALGGVTQDDNGNPITILEDHLRRRFDAADKRGDRLAEEDSELRQRQQELVGTVAQEISGLTDRHGELVRNHSELQSVFDKTISRMTGRIEVVERRPTVVTEELPEGLAEKLAAVDTLTGRVDALNEQINGPQGAAVNLITRVTSLEARPAVDPELAGKVDALNGRTDAVEGRVTELEGWRTNVTAGTAGTAAGTPVSFDEARRAQAALIYGNVAQEFETRLGTQGYVVVNFTSPQTDLRTATYEALGTWFSPETRNNATLLTGRSFTEVLDEVIGDFVDQSLALHPGSSPRDSVRLVSEDLHKRLMGAESQYRAANTQFFGAGKALKFNGGANPERALYTAVREQMLPQDIQTLVDAHPGMSVEALTHKYIIQPMLQKKKIPENYREAWKNQNVVIGLGL